jgi:hypothetical protein
MLGSQFTLNMPNQVDNSKYLRELHELMMARLSMSMQTYIYDLDDISSLQILAFKVSYTDSIKPKGFTKLFNKDMLGVHSKLINTPKYKLDLIDNKVLANTMELNTYGSIMSDSKKDDFISKVKNHTIKDIKFEKDTLFYLNKNNKYVTVVNKYLLNDSINHNISVYTVDGGHIFHSLDSKLSINSFKRTIGNLTKVVDVISGNIVNTEIEVKLNFIKANKYTSKNKNKNILNTASRFIGTLDLETYVDQDKNRVYALGYHTSVETKTFYIDPITLDSDELILRCIDSMTREKYSGYTFYVHNLGGYDIYFLLKVLVNTDKYKLSLLSRSGKILSLTIKLANKSGYSIKLVDSYNILSHKLKDLCVTYVTEVSKDIFPYTFMNRGTLFYDGVKPNISYYNKDVSEKEYNLIPLN